MSNSKKILRIILFLILFIPTYFAIYNIYIISSDKFTVENVSKVEIWAGMNGPVLAEYATSGDIKLFIKTMDNAEEVSAASRPIEYEQPLILVFFKGEKQFVYGLYLSLQPNDCIIKTSGGGLLHMKEDDSRRILDTTLSDTLYENNNLPVARLYQGDETVDIYPVSGEWNLKKAGGKLCPSTVPNLIMAENQAKDYQSRPFDMRFAAEPDLLYVEVKDGKDIIFSNTYTNFAENFSCDEMKDLQYTVTATWDESEYRDYCGSATYVINVKYYVPARFDISHTEANPGDIVAVTAYNMGGDEKLSIASDTETGFEPTFITAGANRTALIPIGADLAGKRIGLTVKSDVNDPVEFSLRINEKADKSPHNMGAQDSFADAHLSETAKSEKQSKYNEIFAVSPGDNEKYWTGKFEMPRDGNLVPELEFGRTLTINMGSAHINNGIYIQADKGDPVKASNAGKVVFVGEIPYDGKLIVIDHGMGIKTWYGHLDAIEVNAGDGVIKGQQIGRSGSTGMYTNQLANLYFALSVKNIFVNPVLAVMNGIPGIDFVNAGGTERSGNDNIDNAMDTDDTGMPEAAAGDNAASDEEGQ